MLCHGHGLLGMYSNMYTSSIVLSPKLPDIATLKHGHLAVKNDLVSVLTAIRPAWKAKAPNSSELTFIFNNFLKIRFDGYYNWLVF